MRIHHPCPACTVKQSEEQSYISSQQTSQSWAFKVNHAELDRHETRTSTEEGEQRKLREWGGGGGGFGRWVLGHEKFEIKIFWGHWKCALNHVPFRNVSTMDHFIKTALLTNNLKVQADQSLCWSSLVFVFHPDSKFAGNTLALWLFQIQM